MALHRETPHGPVNEILTGDYTGAARMISGYFTWRPHGTPDWLLTYTTGGKARYGYQGGEMIVQTGDLVLLKPGTLHDYSVEPSLERWEVLWAHFHPRRHWYEWLQWPEVAPGLMRLSVTESRQRASITRRLRAMNELATGAQHRREAFAMNALEEVLLLADALNPAAGQVPLDARIADAMEYLCRNLNAKVTLPTVARASGLSPSRLAHLFREQVGMTTQQYLELQRLQRAQQLLQFTSRTIAEIAAEVGFENAFYFSLRFKKLTGKNPRDYRRQTVG